MKAIRILLPIACLSLCQCVVEVPQSNYPGSPTQLPETPSRPNYGGPLSAEVAQGAVTIRQGGRVLTSFRTARPNVEQTRWYSEQEQIVVKSRGNRGPATIELFESRTGRRLGSVMAYEAASGPPWARRMAE